MKPSVILLDIEGTTTPISFVYDVLFPYARKHMRAWLDVHAQEAAVQEDLKLLAEENAADRSSGADVPAISAGALQIGSAADYLLWLMDRDRKSPALKSVQGKIWESGYASGELHSIVFPDVPEAMERWSHEGRRIVIYSSGSVLAQKLIFGHTQGGDLRGWIEDYFDTAVGAKTQTASYRAIAAKLGTAPDEILFVSDAPAELQAAQEAGFGVRLAVRPGNKPVDPGAGYERVDSFAGL